MKTVPEDDVLFERGKVALMKIEVDAFFDGVKRNLVPGRDAYEIGGFEMFVFLKKIQEIYEKEKT